MTSKKSILLIGLGRFGRHIAMKLDELHHQVMAVDKEDSRVEAILPFVTNAQIGDATNEDFLSSLGIRNFDVCIVAIGDNFQNSLETTSLLKELGAKMVVSRASRDIHAKFLLRNGADEIVYPEKQLANWTAIRYSSDHILDYIELDEDHAIFELSVPHEWTGKTVGQLDIRKKYDINIMAVKTNGILNLKVNGYSEESDGNACTVVKRIGRRINLLDRTLTMEKTDGEIAEDNLDWEKKEADMDAALDFADSF